jgi:hypothetical protein
MNWRKNLKAVLCNASPEVAIPFFSARTRKHAQTHYSRLGCDEILRQIIVRYGDRVLSGPFVGMQLPKCSYSEHLAPYLLGVYESELHPSWDAIMSGCYSQIVDIGAKFGYYAVGLTRRLSSGDVVAFDTDPWARDAIVNASEINGVRKRIEVLGFCDVKWLKTNLKDQAMILCDCEGFEDHLLDPQAVTALKTSVVVVETHDHQVPGVTERLRQRFLESHEIIEIPSNESQRLSPVDLGFLTKRQQELAISDLRPEQSWLVCVPKESRNRNLIQTIRG